MQECMNWSCLSFDWNQARAFLATAEEGSLSAAARALGQTQPTLGRQVASLEEQLGVTLFQRVGRSLTLTTAGLELLDHVRAMGEAAGRVSLTASGQSQAIEGQVSITATDITASYLLPPVLKRLRDAAPGIEVEVIAANDIRDLRRREADIAIRHVRPEQPDLIAKKVGETEGRFYAATSYLEARGRPTKVEDLAQADFIGLDHVDRLVAFLRDMGLPIDRGNFKITTNSGTVLLQLARQGFGVTVLTQETAELASELERILPEIPAVPVPVWLVTHRELHTSRRIRIVFDLLAEAFAANRFGLDAPAVRP